MSLDTISLSDIGKSLVAIEAEIQSEFDRMDYLEKEIRASQKKIRLLQDTASNLCKNGLPHIFIQPGQMRP